jgi:hypothetical protein
MRVTRAAALAAQGMGPEPAAGGLDAGEIRRVDVVGTLPALVDAPWPDAAVAPPSAADGADGADDGGVGGAFGEAALAPKRRGRPRSGASRAGAGGALGAGEAAIVAKRLNARLQRSLADLEIAPVDSQLFPQVRARLAGARARLRAAHPARPSTRARARCARRAPPRRATLRRRCSPRSSAAQSRRPGSRSAARMHGSERASCAIIGRPGGGETGARSSARRSGQNEAARRSG